MNWKTFFLVTAISVAVTTVLGILAWFLYISPKETGYLAEYSKKEVNIRGEIGGLRSTIGDYNNSIKYLTEAFKDQITYQVAYGLRTDELRSDIPTFYRSLQIEYEVDSIGVITRIDTTGKWETFVPPISGWRDWQKLGYVPRQLASVDTSNSFERGDDEYFWVAYRFEPIFEPITEEQLLATMGKLGNKILGDKKAEDEKQKAEAGEVEAPEAADNEKKVEEKVAETKKEVVPVAKPPALLKKRPAVPKNF